MLRDYQQQAHDAGIEWIKKSIEPCVIEAATGAGKSHIIAALAETIYGLSGKHILCLAPSAELVTQNREKFLLTGQPASIFSSSAGGKCLRHPVVFGTPGTVKNAISMFGSKFALIIIDECHGVTPTIKKIIDCIRLANHKVRVIGLSATPYRLGSGYIYGMDENDKPTGDQSCKDPYFVKKVFTVQAHTLIDRGFLSAPVIGATGQNYDTIDMQLNSKNQFDSGEIERAFVGHGRLTSAIVAEVVHNSVDKKGVMLFAATVQHAEEVLASLPANSRLITGKTTNRKEIISEFKKQKFKYLVSIGTLTTGFDACHVDHIALLRATESVGLLQQIIGRGLRISDSKKDCLVSDYGENIDRHCPDGDLFNPEIKARFKGDSSGIVSAVCESCNTENSFSARKNDEGYEYDENGYFTDLDNNRIETEFGPIPSHHGRRCQGGSLIKGSFIQCGYRWTEKLCPHCDSPNDIAARYCCDCRGEIIDPNEKLRMDFKALKRDPTRVQTDNVIEWTMRPTVSGNGNECLRIDYKTEYRKFSIWYMPESQRGRQLADWHQLNEATNNREDMPKTITYKKDAESKFYRVFGFNNEVDEI